MSASDQLPLTVTYTPTSGVTTTVTVLGQVLNNGATNWVPTMGHAIYLATTSESGASQTVLDGSTYYLTTGPAVPDQATDVTITLSSSAAASGSQMAPMTSSGGASSAAATSASNSASITMQSRTKSASPSKSSGAPMSTSSTSTKTGAGSRSVSSASKLGYVLACVCLAGVVMA